MPDEPTINLGLTKPLVGASRDSWGGKTNQNWDDVDSIFADDGSGTPVGLHIGPGQTLLIEGEVAGTGAYAPGTVPISGLENILADRILGRGNVPPDPAPVELLVCTAAGRAILDDADAAAQRVTLGAQAADATLTSLSALGTAPDMLAYTTAVDVWAEAPLTPFARTIIDDVDAAAMRATLGVSLAFFPRGYIDGYNMIVGADVINDVLVNAGQCTADSGDYMISLAAPITKKLSAVWAVGDGVGGLDTGAKAADTWYHVHAIARPDTGVVDVLLSLSATAPTMPASYTKKRRIGSIRYVDGTDGILAFDQLGGWFEWKKPLTPDFSDGTTALTARTLTVPPGVRVLADITPVHQHPGGSGDGPSNLATNFQSMQAAAPPGAVAQDPTAGSITDPFVVGPGQKGTWQSAGRMLVRTNLLAQVRTRANGAVNKVGIITHGWHDFRGQNA